MAIQAALADRGALIGLHIEGWFSQRLLWYPLNFTCCILSFNHRLPKPHILLPSFSPQRQVVLTMAPLRDNKSFKVPCFITDIVVRGSEIVSSHYGCAC